MGEPAVSGAGGGFDHLITDGIEPDLHGQRADNHDCNGDGNIGEHDDAPEPLPSHLIRNSHDHHVIRERALS